MPVNPHPARELRLMCPHCYGTLNITLAYPYTAERRARATHEAVEEHRRVCDKAPLEAQRVYTIEYPR